MCWVVYKPFLPWEVWSFSSFLFREWSNLQKQLFNLNLM
jgi:hypothetical protein